MHKSISAEEYSKKESMRIDPLFHEFTPLLQIMTTVVTFVWKPPFCQGKFKPIP